MQSRYYNPKTGRFINADALVTTGQGLLGNNMFAYCLNNPAMYIDPDGYCMEVGALLTWIDCGNPECSTSSLSDPERYRGGYNNPKHIDSQRYYEEQAKTIETINIPIPEPVEVGIKGFAVGFCVGSLSGLAGAAFTAGMSPVMSGVAVGLLTGIEELIRYIIGNP